MNGRLRADSPSLTRFSTSSSVVIPVSLPVLGSQEPPFCEAEGVAAGDDEMIEDADVDQRRLVPAQQVERLCASESPRSEPTADVAAESLRPSPLGLA